MGLVLNVDNDELFLQNDWPTENLIGSWNQQDFDHCKPPTFWEQDMSLRKTRIQDSMYEDMHQR